MITLVGKRSVSVELRTLRKFKFSTGIASKEVMEREKKTVATNYESLPVVIEKGKGVYMWDVDGKRYLDFFAGFATLNQGHCHDRIVKAMQDQVATLHHTSRAIYHNLLHKVSEKLTQLFQYEKVLLTNTGVEGGETAVKLARLWGYKVKKIGPGQARVVFAEGNFWGRTMAAISSSTDGKMFKGFEPLMPGFDLVPYDNLAKLEDKLRDPNVCAFMVEPVQGEAGAVVPSPGYLAQVRELCTRHNVLWISDEVQTGLGRTGALLATHKHNVKPDVLILGKALSGGVYPVSAVLADAGIMDCFTPGTHGSTYGGNPLGCRVAIEALDVILEERLSENAEKMGKIFREELGMRLRHDRVQLIRGEGLLNALVLKKDAYDTKGICCGMIEKGLVTRYINENVVRFSPALTITESQLKEGLDIIVDVINTAPKK